MQTADFDLRDVANKLTLRDVANKFIDTFPTSLLTSFASFSPFCNRFEDEAGWLADR